MIKPSNKFIKHKNYRYYWLKPAQFLVIALLGYTSNVSTSSAQALLIEPKIHWGDEAGSTSVGDVQLFILTDGNSFAITELLSMDVFKIKDAKFGLNGGQKCWSKRGGDYWVKFGYCINMRRIGQNYYHIKWQDTMLRATGEKFINNVDFNLTYTDSSCSIQVNSASANETHGGRMIPANPLNWAKCSVERK
ncbi:hypothetical protein FV228_01405 [Methylobacterium sp. WL18]|uniref:hypothetical protein n=1 Tax=Methylobacterium sp. WL18 TaxID=2603897 RepID=UPI0011CAB556|nr:hypothetical protein [Methylobacterium sp. WL18]TXN76183.1 hypothetical protein FV228_01405 [Methylobacterium sp. WL18]